MPELPCPSITRSSRTHAGASQPSRDLLVHAASPSWCFPSGGAPKCQPVLRGTSAPQLKAGTRLETVLLTSASCSLSHLHLFFYYLGVFSPRMDFFSPLMDFFSPLLDFSPTDGSFSLHLHCSLPQFSVKKCDLTHTHTPGVTSPVPVCHISPGPSPDSTGGGSTRVMLPKENL